MNGLKKKKLISKLDQVYRGIKQLSDSDYKELQLAVAEGTLENKRELVSIMILMRVADFSLEEKKDI